MSLALLADAPCSECGALLDQGQRYCVHCGRRRQDVEDPAVSWLAESYVRRAQRAPTTVVAQPATRNPLALPALALAVLPLAVAVGVLVGHHGGGTSEAQLLEALRSQKAPVVKIGSAAGGAGLPASTASKGLKKRSRARASVARRDKTGGKVVASTKYGVAHQVSGFKPTATKVQSDRKLVQKINSSIGKNYLNAQKNLPDTIVVTGGGNANSPTAQGRGD